MDETSGSEAERVPVERARDRLAAAVDPVDRTETLPLGTATGRPLAEPVVARRPLPHYDRATVDGFALRAADLSATDGDAAGRDERPSLTVADAEAVEPGTATRVDAGDPLPDGADAVVPLSAVESAGDRETGAALASVVEPATEVAVPAGIGPGDGVEETGAQYAAGETVFPAGRRLSGADPAVCAAVGRTRVEAVQRPTVGVVPTGEGLVAGDPGVGEVVETDGRTLAALVGHWGGKVTRRDDVGGDPHALRAAVERDLTRDLLVTTGGTGRGERDRLYDVLADLGEVECRGLALEPGGTAGVAVVRERPVVVLPGDPVGCLVAALELLGPALARLGRRPEPEPVRTRGRLASPVESRRGVRTVVPVAVEDGPEGAGERGVEGEKAVRRLATPASATLRDVVQADGWVAVPEPAVGMETGESVTVETWTATTRVA